MSSRFNAALLAVVLIVGGCQFGKLSLPTSDSDTEQAKIRQKILLSPRVSGVSQHVQKKKIIALEKTEQEAKVEPLLGLLREKNERQIDALLGAPDRKLRVEDAQVWQYLTEVCQWDMYFLGSTTMRETVLHDVIIHYRGEILTSTEEIARCEAQLREDRRLKLPQTG